VRVSWAPDGRRGGKGLRRQTALVLQFWENTSGVHPHRMPQSRPHAGFPMAGTLKKIVLILMAALLCLGVAVPAYGTRRRPAPKRVAQPEQAAPVVEVVPAPAPLTLEQQPASPPRISYQGGQLTIAAPNSTLGDILRGVHAQTGAAVEVPGNATERVVGYFGPGPARDVLAALLNGSHFNYVILGSVTNPGGVERVVLTSKAGGGETSPVAQFANQPSSQPSVEPPEAPGANGGGSSDDQVVEQPGDDGQSDQDDDQPQEQQPGVRSPEQLLRELQQRQQQQQGNPTQGQPLPPGQQPPQPPR
jgi:hypothetical protein